jgi:pilus assembly protein CpaC
MHRKNRIPRVLLSGLLLLGLALGQSARLQAQEDKAPQAKQKTLAVAINGTERVSMSNRQVIASVETDKEGVIQVVEVPTDQRVVILRGMAAGIVKLTLTAQGGKERETYEVIVQTDIELLRSLLQRAVPTSSVVPIPGAGNTIILTGWVAHSEDIPTILEVAQTFTAAGAGASRIVNALKVGGVMQVQLDVVVARVSRSELRRMAVDLFQIGEQHQFVNSVGQSIVAPTGSLATVTGLTPLTNIVGSPNGSPANSFLAIFTQRQVFFLFLQALRDNSLAKLLAEPHLVTMSGKPAQFVSGGEQAVPQVSGLGGTAGISFVPFGTTLNFLPIVLGNGKIYLEVEPEISALDAAAGASIAGTVVPGRATQRVRTAVEIEPGQTLAIGGLIQNVVQASTTKFPVLGDLPFLGTLFSRKSYNEVEEELVILVTPHLVDPMACDQLPKFLPGQETRRPDDFELFLEGIMEAPRGQRKVCPDRRYVPAYKHSPSMNKYPCGANGNGCDGSPDCGLNGNGSVNAKPTALAPVATAAAPGQTLYLEGNVVPVGDVVPASGPALEAMPAIERTPVVPLPVAR